MPAKRSDLHTKQVEAWKKKNSGLSDKELPRLFINGILAVRSRSLGTLSNVTVTVVVDRVLLECQERFSILSHLSSDSQGIHFDKFSVHIEDSKPREIQDALEELLLELLEAFGKITADILTKNLHKELMATTYQTSKNRDQK